MISPRGTNFQNWAAQTTILIDRFGQIPRPPTDEKKWRDWASLVVMLPSIAALNPPQPQLWPEWKDWARRFNETMYLRGIE